ncbi:MAG: hypothetical protein BYD32DRAFT_464758 [Podila humilis]|nr:MAG: hypothetical protein BYD32DRAFT_464758 [Podila humilis]
MSALWPFLVVEATAWTLVQETQKMLQLEVVTVLGQRGPDPVSKECKWKRYDGWWISSFEPARVLYCFPELCEQEEQTYIRDVGLQPEQVFMLRWGPIFVV